MIERATPETLQSGTPRHRDLFALGLATVAGALLLAAWAHGIARREFNYDELLHAHAVWMVSDGLRPLVDFLEGHPPFPWYPLSPLARGIDDPLSLMMRLRAASAIAGLAMIALVIANVRSARREIAPTWTLAAILLMISGRPNLDYFVDFRPDALATLPLLGATLLLARRTPASTFGRYTVASFLATASIVSSPKLLALWGFAALVDLLTIRRDGRATLARAVAGHAAGSALALGLAAGAIAALGVNLRAAWDMTIGVHALLGRKASFGHGLARALVEQKVLLAFILAGVLAWGILIVRRRISPTVFEISTLLFLALQAALVPFPYRQYFAPWFLLGATFVHFIPLALQGHGTRIARLAASAMLLIALSAALISLIGLSSAEGVRSAARYWSLVRANVPRDARVVAAIRLHPVTMRDACWAWVRGGDPAGRYETVEAMRDLDIPGFSNRVEPAHFTRELEQARPALIALSFLDEDRLGAVYAEAVAAYLARHAADYATIEIPNGVVMVRRTRTAP